MTLELRPDVNFLPNFVAVVRGAVREKNQSSVMHVPLSSRREVSGA